MVSLVSIWTTLLGQVEGGAIRGVPVVAIKRRILLRLSTILWDVRVVVWATMVAGRQLVPFAVGVPVFAGAVVFWVGLVFNVDVRGV